MEQQGDTPTSIDETIGMKCWEALQLDLDWSGHWPIMDRLTLRIVGILDKSADTSEYFFVDVPDWLTWTMNGNDAAIKNESSRPTQTPPREDSGRHSDPGPREPRVG